ncbi:MAG: T9SS type A sorting domain-containing protein [Melioribacteraceae bacterium]|nr:T9SS type A sorting domain-containing protein [Melioribacteraceae bacterium]
MKQLTLLLLFSLTSTLIAQIRYVPTDYSIIQDAIDLAQDGDTIIVEEGIYYEQFRFKGKAITVASRFLLEPDTNYISNTIIDGSQLPENDSSSLVYFINDETLTSVLCGFTLQNGKGTKVIYEYREGYYIAGGSIFMSGSGGTIKNNIIRNNSFEIDLESKNDAYAGGIFSDLLSEDNELIIENNKLYNNSIAGTVATGAAIDVGWHEGFVTISKNRVSGNRARAKDSGYGGGINIWHAVPTGNVIIENNLISDNTVSSGFPRGGGIACQDVKPIIRNNVVLRNSVHLKVPDSVITNEVAKGGGISVRWKSNKASYPAILLDATIENNTVLYNKAEYGSGIHIGNSNFEIRNCIVRLNGAILNSKPQININIIGSDKSKYKQIVCYSNVQGGHEGEGNIDIDPRFGDSRFYCLSRTTSECIDAGDPDVKYEDVEDPDSTGIPWAPAFGTLRNDMGAYGGPNAKWGEMKILEEISTDVNDINSILPDDITLSQNYPNPFNPSTTIKYSIATASTEYNSVLQNVILKVYDLLGQEVATLVNEAQKPGNYEVIWNPSADGLSVNRHIPSGVYFYKLTYGDYTITKKLVLLK